MPKQLNWNSPFHALTNENLTAPSHYNLIKFFISENSFLLFVSILWLLFLSIFRNWSYFWGLPGLQKIIFQVWPCRLQGREERRAPFSPRLGHRLFNFSNCGLGSLGECWLFRPSRTVDWKPCAFTCLSLPPPPSTDQDYFFTAVLTQVGQDFWIPSIRSFCVSCGTLSNSTTPMTLTGNVFFCLPDHYQWKRCKPRAGQPLAPGGPAQHFSSLPSLEPQAGGNTIHHFFGCKLCKKMHSIFKKRKWNKQKMASSLSSLLPIPLLSYICPLSFTPSHPQHFSHIFPRWVFKCIDSGMRKPVCGSLFHNFIALLSSGWRNLTLCTVTSSFRKWW